ncbi:Hypothetical predicted protein [Marmota monax]|uniref:Uncharacterized protein n=1 Tax=Marmota monax TaxID=9995 RepID=A0A5E4AXT1_MARMO|nr:Hypothetical predicted protein [Marmota monax]
MPTVCQCVQAGRTDGGSHSSLTESTDYIQHLGSALANLSPCSIPHRIYRQAHSLLCSFLPWSGISTKGGIEYSRTMSWRPPASPLACPSCRPGATRAQEQSVHLVSNRLPGSPVFGNLPPPGALVLPPCTFTIPSALPSVAAFSGKGLSSPASPTPLPVPSAPSCKARLNFLL